MKNICALRKKNRLTAVGLMSGTSADGITAALASFRTARETEFDRVIVLCETPYPRGLRERVLDAGSLSAADVCRMNFELGELFAKAALRVVRKAGMKPADVDLVGSHGQTVWHVPRRGAGRGIIPSSLQIGEPSVIAERTGILTVADFRMRDIAAGGEGAPLVPYADWLLFRRAGRNIVLQNIGGIANVTVVTPRLEDVLAFDTGPGNCLIDAAVRRFTLGKAAFDDGGRIALGGEVDPRMLAALLAHPYFRLKPPKSACKEMFTPSAEKWLAACGSRKKKRVDAVATLAEFTALSIFESYRRFVLPRFPIDGVVVSGGGVRNAALMRRLSALFSPVSVTALEAHGMDSKAREAVAFALLGVQAVRGIPSNVPSATGARRPVVLGKIIG
jgi:anhydro-N-acetylmuramic acid kinase